MVVLHTCMNEDLIKNEGARVLTRLYDILSDAQGQLTPKSTAEFCPNSNSSKLFCKYEQVAQRATIAHLTPSH